MSAMATPKDSALTGSDSYQKFTVLDEQIEVYLRITKLDEETGKPVLLPVRRSKSTTWMMTAITAWKTARPNWCV